MELKIYTDGACSGNPGKGGWAAIILDEKSNQFHISGKLEKINLAKSILTNVYNKLSNKKIEKIKIDRRNSFCDPFE